MNKKKRVMSCALVGLLSAGLIFGAGAQNPGDMGNVRVKRLAGLCRLWGVVKYFHPYTAYKPIDWDQALVKTIPLVDAAAGDEDYRKALDHLLSFLHDPMTKTLGEDAPAPNKDRSAAPAAPAAPELSLKWPKPGIALITVNDYFLFTDPEKTGELAQKMQEASPAATVIVDIRRTRPPESQNDLISIYYFNQAFLQAIPLLFQGECPLPSTRHRVHTGYPPQIGESSGGYSAGFFYGQEGGLKGHSVKSPSLLFVLDGWPNGVEPILSGLQSSGRALLIQEGESPQETEAELYNMTLPGGVAVAIRMTETVNPDGSLSYRPAVSVASKTADSDPAMKAAMEIASGKSKPAGSGTSILPPNPVLAKENAYPDMIYPDREYRLLSLFRLWNVIHYFYPYKSLMDIPWDQSLEDFIPRFEKAKDVADYNLCVEELVSRIDDSHCFIYNSESINQMYDPPIIVRWIENQTVVTNIFPGEDGSLPKIGVGDIVLAVDGEDIAGRRERLGRTIAASTPQSLAVRVHQSLFHGAKDSEAKIKFRDARGNTHEIAVKRTARFLQSERTTPVFGVLPEGFGYMDLARLQPGDVDKAFEAVKKTPALIMDMRGYPLGTIWSIAPRLAKEKTVGARFQGEELHAGGSLDNPFRIVVEATAEPGGPWRYEGKVIVLINEEAISQAEHTCLFLETVAHARFVGSPTMGANGDVTRTVLPGRIIVNFTGIDVRHADGRQLQRVGIQPDVPVRPTIAGIRAGKDEILERAVEELKKETRR